MVLLVPEVSVCSINSEKDIASLSSTKYQNSATRYNLSQLSHTLQASLDTDKILQLFFKQIKHEFKLSKLLYINEEHDVSILLGSKLNTTQTHKKNIKKFKLYFQKEYLGEINFVSKLKLTPGVILELKHCVNFLIMPLKNSLLYTAAIKATRTDPLTQLGNRLSLLEDIKYHFNLSSRYSSPLSIIFLDIDFFKNINDNYGHIVGDKILVKLAEILKANIRKSDSIYRFGGEEFVIILENTNHLGAVSLAKKIKQLLSKLSIPIKTNSSTQLFKITMSMGISSKHLKDSPDSLMTRADNALYKAKEKGRNCYITAP